MDIEMLKQKQKDLEKKRKVINAQIPSNLSPDEEKIYKLIRDPLILSFMKPALYIQYDLEIKDERGNLLKTRI